MTNQGTVMIAVFHPTLRLALLILATLTTAYAGGVAVPLFDGKALDGWEGNRAVWRIEDGAITGGSMAGNPRNEFLATTNRYRNFILRLEYRIVGSEGFINGGVQFHSVRLAEPAFEMSGYQADIGPDRSGNLYDEAALAAAKFAMTAHDPRLKFEDIEKSERPIVAALAIAVARQQADHGEQEAQAEATVPAELEHGEEHNIVLYWAGCGLAPSTMRTTMRSPGWTSRASLICW